MAARLRYDNSVGVLGASLTSGATTVTFASAPGWVTITGGDYIPLIIDPPSGNVPNPNFEVVHVTAYTSGATTATIVRGQEGTSGVAHANGATWQVAPVAADFGTIVPLRIARAYLAAAWTPASPATWTQVPIDTLNFDTNPGDMDVTTNNRYTCSVAGHYQVNGQFDMQTSGAGVNVSVGIFLNGVQASKGSSADDLGPVVADILNCAIGDHIDLRGWIGTLPGFSGSGATYLNYLSVALLG